MYNKSWYNELNRSSLSPPSWVFKFIWPILYFMMGISFYITLKDEKCSPFCRPLVFFLIQLAFNLSWTTVFFRFRKIKIALVVILLILLFTILTLNDMYKVNKTAFYILIPYILWLSFATYLNTYIVINN